MVNLKMHTKAVFLAGSLRKNIKKISHIHPERNIPILDIPYWGEAT